MSTLKDKNHIKWIASFDVEPLLSSILVNGTTLSMILIGTSIVAQWLRKTGVHFGPNLHARSIPALIMMDIHDGDLAAHWPKILIHLAVVVLMLTPYLRVLASTFYFAFIERSWRHTVFSGFVLIITTIALLTTLV